MIEFLKEKGVTFRHGFMAFFILVKPGNRFPSIKIHDRRKSLLSARAYLTYHVFQRLAVDKLGECGRRDIIVSNRLRGA